MSDQKRILVAGGGGFIGGHFARKMKNFDHHVIAADWKEQEFFQLDEFCHEFQIFAPTRTVTGHVPNVTGFSTLLLTWVAWGSSNPIIPAFYITTP